MNVQVSHLKQRWQRRMFIALTFPFLLPMAIILGAAFGAIRFGVIVVMSAHTEWMRKEPKVPPHE